MNKKRALIFFVMQFLGLVLIPTYHLFGSPTETILRGIIKNLPFAFIAALLMTLLHEKLMKGVENK